MKKAIQLAALLLLCTVQLFAQAPQKFNYQAVARDANGNALATKKVVLRTAIMSGEHLDRPVYEEEHTVTTNKLGLFNIAIGTGETLHGEFETIDWGSAAHYLSIQMDTDHSGHFEDLGLSQLLSVPYALYAERSRTAADAGDVRTDPNDWTMNGNAGTDDAVNFIGTLDAKDLVVRANDAEVARFTTDKTLRMVPNARITFGDNNAINMNGVRNIHIGERAGQLSTGDQNAFIGYNAGFSNTTGAKNTFIGPTAGRVNTVGAQNAFIGGRAGFNNTEGSQNAFIGWLAGRDNTTGNENTFIGKYAGQSNTTGNSNTFVGAGSDGSTDLINATAVGANASVTQSNSVVLGNNANVGIGTSAPASKLHVAGSIRMVDGNEAAGYIPVSNAAGMMVWTAPSDLSGVTALADADDDTKVEVEASADEDIIRLTNPSGSINMVKDRLEFLNSNYNSVYIGDSTGILGPDYSVIIGSKAGKSSLASSSIAIGREAMQELHGNYNTVVGTRALKSLSSGGNNTVVGAYAMRGVTTTSNVNVAVGNQAFENGSGSMNVIVGADAGRFSSGNLNVFLGPSAGENEVGSNKLFIENTNTSTPLIYGEFDNDIVGINGRLGVGTESPATKLDVNGGGWFRTSAGGLPSSADKGVRIFYDGTNNLGSIFSYDYATSSPKDLALQAPGGNVGIGITDPSYVLHVENNASNYVASFSNSYNGAYSHGILVQSGQDVRTTYNAYLGFSRPDGTVIGAVFQNTSSSVSYNTTSDKRLKTGITETKYGLEDLMQIEVKDYVYRSDANKQRVTGFLAQDLYEIYPDAVAVGGDDPNTNPWGVDYGKLTPLLVKAVQDLTKLVEEQQKRIEELEAQR